MTDENNIYQEKLLVIDEILNYISSMTQAESLEELVKIIPSLLAAIGNFTNADRAYVFDWADEKKECVNNTFEWCAEGVKSEIDSLQGVPVSLIPNWIDTLNRKETILIEDINDIESTWPTEYLILKEQDVTSLIAVPIYAGKNLEGFIGIDNPDMAKKNDISLKILYDMSCQLGCIRENIRVLEMLAHKNKELNEKQMILQHQNEQLQAEKVIMDSLCIDYATFFHLDFEKNLIYILKRDALMSNFSGDKKEDFVSMSLFDNFIGQFYNAFVDKEKSKDFSEVLSFENVKNHLLSERRFSYRFVSIPYNDEVYYLEATVTRCGESFPLQAVMGFRIINDVVEEEQRRNEELSEALERAKRADLAKTNFLFNMSHDIRTPLNALLGYNLLIKKELVDPKLLDYEEKIEQAGNLLLSIINNVLDMARIESGNVEIEETPILVEDVINEIKEVFVVEAKKKNITLSFNSSIKHNSILCDETKIKEIVLNLISNSIKYTPEGGKVKVSVIEEESNNKDKTVIKTIVEDNGIGMSKEFLAKIYENFSREKNTTLGNVSGTGLGMSIVKKLVNMMGGTIGVESEVNKGTRFTVTLEFKLTNDNVNQNDINDTFDENYIISLRGKRILLVEDNELNAEIAIAILENGGFIVERAVDGLDSLNKIKEHDDSYYDLVLMDIQMPNMNGYEATRAIRKLDNKVKANVPIVAMTANAFKEDEKNAYEAGMNGHVSKPINLEKLHNAIYNAFLKK